MSQFLQFNLNLPGNKKKYTWRGFLNSWLSKEHPKVTPCIPPFPYSILCGCYTIWRPLSGTPTLSLRSSSLLSHFHPHPFPSPILHCLFPIFVSLIMPSHLPISFSSLPPHSLISIHFSLPSTSTANPLEGFSCLSSFMYYAQHFYKESEVSSSYIFKQK